MKGCENMGNHLKDITGEQYGYLTAMEFDHRDKNRTYWRFRCKCGKEVIRATYKLYDTKTPSCGCYQLELNEQARVRREEQQRTKEGKVKYRHYNSKKYRDLSGEKYGRLKVINKTNDNVGLDADYLCLCDCGRSIIKTQQYLINNKIPSCGCARKNAVPHDADRDRLKRIYNGMINRCYNKNSDSYKYYGKKGIVVCEWWLSEGGFDSFCRWALANGYSNDLTIDRINVYGNYTPRNCRWADIKTQANNTTKTHTIEYNGELMGMKEFAEKMGLNYAKVGIIVRKDKVLSGDYIVEKYNDNYKNKISKTKS